MSFRVVEASLNNLKVIRENWKNQKHSPQVKDYGNDDIGKLSSLQRKICEVIRRWYLNGNRSASYGKVWIYERKEYTCTKCWCLHVEAHSIQVYKPQKVVKRLFNITFVRLDDQMVEANKVRSWWLNWFQRIVHFLQTHRHSETS
jgi:hypothetical protein